MRKLFGAGAAQSIEATQNISARMVTLTAAAADASCDIIGNGTSELKLAAKAGESVVFMATGPQWVHLTAPSTITVVGAGAFVRIDA